MGTVDEDAWLGALEREQAVIRRRRAIGRRDVHDIQNVRGRDGGRHVDTPEHRRSASRMAAARAHALRQLRKRGYTTVTGRRATKPGCCEAE